MRGRMAMQSLCLERKPLVTNWAGGVREQSANLGMASPFSAGMLAC